MVLRDQEAGELASLLRQSLRLRLQPNRPENAALARGSAHEEEGRDVARYRQKDETDLVWNRIRRQLTRDLDTEIQNRRETVLNELLSGAWEEYTLALKKGTVLEVEAKYQRLFKQIVRDIVVAEELPRGDVA